MAFVKQHNKTLWKHKPKEGEYQGEPGTGFEKADGKGEFSCRNCVFSSAEGTRCSSPDMLKKSKLPRHTDKQGTVRVVVDPMGVCKYVDRTGEYKS